MICKLQQLLNEFDGIMREFESKEFRVYDLTKLYGVCCKLEYQAKKLISQENIEDMEIVYKIQALEQNILNTVTRKLREAEVNE